LKKIGSLVVVSLFISSVAFASPLMDYSAGKGSIDLTWRDTKNTENLYGQSYDYNKKYNLDGMLTFGLGNKFAVQYRNFEPTSADTTWGGDVGTFKLTTNEVNVLYKLDKNIAILAGWVNAKGYAQDNTNSGGSNGFNTKNLWQVGVVASTAIAKKTTLWGGIAVGKDLTNYEVGIGYEISHGWEFNVNYRDLDLKKFNSSDDEVGWSNVGLNAKGLGVGITNKF